MGDKGIKLRRRLFHKVLIRYTLYLGLEIHGLLLSRASPSQLYVKRLTQRQGHNPSQLYISMACFSGEPLSVLTLYLSPWMDCRVAHRVGTKHHASLLHGASGGVVQGCCDCSRMAQRLARVRCHASGGAPSTLLSTAFIRLQFKLSLCSSPT